MTEYEAASLAVQHASLAVEEAVLTAAYWQTGISATTSALTLAVSSGLVLYGPPHAPGNRATLGRNGRGRDRR